MTRERAGRLLLYGLLLTAAWGLLVGQRGFWHDEVQHLFRMLAAPGRGELLPRFGTPTRWLLGLPFGLALWTGQPRWALELALGAAWLGSALLAGRVAARVWPGQPALGPLVACLLLCSTGDFFTAALVSLTYVLSGLLLLLGLAAALEYLAGGGAAWLALAWVALAGALGLTEAPMPVWLVAPAGLFWSTAPAARRRTAALAWYSAGLPHLVLLAQALHDPTSYLRRAVVPLAPGAWLLELGRQLLWNLEPWAWGSERSLWPPRDPSTWPTGGLWALALCCGLAFLAWGPLRRSSPAGSASPASLRWALPGLLALVATQALYVAVPLAEFHCRTHLVARLFAGLALGPALLALARRGPAARWIAAGLAAAYVTFGSYGGLERQDYLARHWRRHRVELASLVAAAPRLTPEARMLLRVHESRSYPALPAGYLARAWLSLLHEDPSLECRVFLWSDPRGTTCSARPDGLLCRGERSPDCPGHDGRDEELLPWDRLVYLEQDPDTSRFRLLPELPAEARPAGAPAGYAPARQLQPGPPSAMARRLVGGELAP